MGFDLCYLLISCIWPFVFVCNLVNAIRDERGAMNLSRKASTIWAGIALMMMTVVPSIFSFVMSFYA